MSKPFWGAMAGFMVCATTALLAPPRAAASVGEQTDEETVCSFWTDCPNRSTLLCAEVHLTVGGAGVVYHCYQPIIP